MTNYDALEARLGAAFEHCRDCPAHPFNNDCGEPYSPCNCHGGEEGKLRWKAADAIRELRAEVEALRETLGKLRRGHTACEEDNWYSCQLHDSFPSKYWPHPLRCTCGANEANALIDAAIAGGKP